LIFAENPTHFALPNSRRTTYIYIDMENKFSY